MVRAAEAGGPGLIGFHYGVIQADTEEDQFFLLAFFLQRRWPLHEHAAWHGHPARDVHGQDGHGTTLVAAPPPR